VKPFRLALAAALAVVGISRSGQAQQTDSSAVMTALNGMLTAMRERNPEALRATFHPAARMTLLRPTQDGSTQVVVLTGAQFVDAAMNPQGPVLDEPIRNPRLQLDGDLATVWAEYQVRVEGKVSHCGFDAFQLVRTAGSWKILNVSDTFRRTGCGPIWKL
jgi:crotonobetainyl-CoA:carnitine CoA-transferase CaiB-like acyl-CoA transferase